MIAVIDYGMGNLSSVSRALETVGATVKVTAEPAIISQARGIVLPGVGAFRRGMENIARLELVPAIHNAIAKEKPFLGICLGLQLLFTESDEHGISSGLDIIKGRVERFTAGVKIPHMGWNQIRVIKREKPNLFDSIPDGTYFYFANSYYVLPYNPDVIATTTEYGSNFTSSIARGNIFGVQFHPEKSGPLGLKILENFLALC